MYAYNTYTYIHIHITTTERTFSDGNKASVKIEKPSLKPFRPSPTGKKTVTSKGVGKCFFLHIISVTKGAKHIPTLNICTKMAVEV